MSGQLENLETAGRVDSTDVLGAAIEMRLYFKLLRGSYS